MKNYDVVIAGYTSVDMVPDFKKDKSFTGITDLFKPGKLIEIDGMNFVPGGVVPNTGLALKKFGKKVFLNGLIGDDFIGRIAKEWLDQYDISEGIVSTAAAGTAFSIVLAPPGIDRIFLESPGCNMIFDSAFINFDVISESRIFHFGYPPLMRKFYLNNGRQLHQMFSKIQKMGVITSLDFSLPDPESESGRIDWPGIMKETLPYIDIFVPSLEEVLQIMIPWKYSEILSSFESSGIKDKLTIETIREVGRSIIDSGVKILLIKAGASGAYLLTGNISTLNEKLENKLIEDDWNHKELWCNAYPASVSKIVNASGAGDTAVAAFLSAILDGESPGSSLKYAAVAGRNNLYCNNIYNDLSDWQKMTEEIRSEHVEIIRY
jgi:sugar/nucleoside kinase (ribokinase family)